MIRKKRGAFTNILASAPRSIQLLLVQMASPRRLVASPMDGASGRVKSLRSTGGMMWIVVRRKGRTGPLTWMGTTGACVRSAMNAAPDCISWFSSCL